MQPLILLFDIGNTSIKVGLADSAQLLASYSLPTHTGITADSLGLDLCALLTHAKIDANRVRACMVSSVVPGINPLLRECVCRYMGCPLFFVPEDVPIPLQNRYERPFEVGADRLVGAWAARRLYPDTPSLVVVDFGTAVTFDCIDGMAYLGGLIFPGPHTALASLARETAKLPHVSLEVTASEPCPCRDTATSIQHGLVFGFACMVEGMVHRLSAQLPSPVRVVATGGFAKIMSRLVHVFDSVEPQLLLDGLRNLHYQYVDNRQKSAVDAALSDNI